MLELSLLFILAGIMCISLFLMERSNKEFFWYGIAATSFGLALGFTSISLPTLGEFLRFCSQALYLIGEHLLDWSSSFAICSRSRGTGSQL